MPSPDLAHLLAAIDDPVACLDSHGRVVHVNRAFADLAGRPVEALVGALELPLTPAGSAPSGRDGPHMLETPRGRLTVDVQSMPLSLSDGEVRVLRLRPAHRRAGQIGGVDANHLRSLLGHLPGGVYRRTHGTTWRAVFVSDRFAEICGRSRSSLVGPSGLDLRRMMLPDEVSLLQDAIRRSLDQGRPYEVEYRIQRPDGGVRWVQDQGIAVAGGRGAIRWLDGMLVDITARKKAESTLAQYAADLDQARQMAEEAARTKSDFLAVMSHEIRTPLNAIIGMTGLLLERPLDAREQDYVETIRLSGDALLAIINDILDFSKIDAGRVQLESMPFDLRLCIEEALDLLAPRAAEKRLELLYRLDPAVPDRVVGDVTRLRQIIVNLVSNAVKFTREGEVDVVAALGGPPDADGRIELHITVRDTGIGIPAEQQPRLFEAFRQVDASTTRRFGGTGLGLAISRRLAELMQGRMWVDSTPGEGSTFGFSARVGIAETQPDVQPEPLLVGKRALIVIDHPLAAERLADRLNTWGLVVEAESSAPGLTDRIIDDAPDVMVLDGQVGGTAGEDLVEAVQRALFDRAPLSVLLQPLRRRTPSTPGDTLGPDAELSKPLRDDALRRTLARLFGAESVVTTPAPISASIPSLRLLIAEDNPINQKVALRQLETMGLEADVVADGREAVDALLHAPYDVVLMDVQMPEMDGMEATRRLRERLPSDAQPYVIALTANATRADEIACIASGMDAYLSKPLRRQVLAEALRTAVRIIHRRRRGLSGITNSAR